MRRAPEPRERRAKPLSMVPVCAVHQRDGAAVDLEAYVPAGEVGYSDATLRDLVFSTGQQNGEAALIRTSRPADPDAQRSWRPPVGAWRSGRPVLTKYGQPGHSVLPFRARSARPTIREEWVRGSVVPQVARAQVVTGGGGITNAPITISRLRV